MDTENETNLKAGWLLGAAPDSAFPEAYRYDKNADGSPALRCGLLLSEGQACALNAWFTDRSAALKRDRWRGWNEGDMALRTICVQIDIFSKRAFHTPNNQAHLQPPDNQL